MEAATRQSLEAKSSQAAAVTRMHTLELELSEAQTIMQKARHQLVASQSENTKLQAELEGAPPHVLLLKPMLPAVSALRHASGHQVNTSERC